jgi:D-lactate dehydrogenase (cytochrome)
VVSASVRAFALLVDDQLINEFTECVELVDKAFMRGTNNYGVSKYKYEDKDSLFLKLQGPTPASLKESADIVKKIAAKYGGTSFTVARNEEEAHDMWMDRKNALYSGLSLVPGARGWSTDVW